MQVGINGKILDSGSAPDDNLVDHNIGITTIRHQMEKSISEIGKDGIEDPYIIAFIFDQYLKRLQLKIQEKYGDILDIGAGGGEFAYFAQKHTIFPNTNIKSIDINPRFVEVGKTKGIDIEVMDATSLNFPNESFDMLLSQSSMPQCLFHFDQNRYDRNEKQIEDPKGEEKITQWLHESLCVLKRGGELRFSTVIANDEDYRGSLIKGVLDKLSSKLFTYSEFPNLESTTYILQKS